MFAFPFIILFIVLTVYTNRARKHPIRELEIMDYLDANVHTPLNPSYRAGRTASSPFAIYSAKYWDGVDHFVTFKTMRPSPPFFSAYERGEKFQAYVSPDGKTIALEKDVTQLRKIAKAILILYLIITCLVEVAPVVYFLLSTYLPQIIPAGFSVNIAGLFALLPSAAVGLVFTRLGVVQIRKVSRNKKARNEGLYREVHATVTQVIPQGFGKNVTYYPVFSYNITGTQESMTSTVGQRPPKYDVGDHVTLYQHIETREMKEPSDFSIGFFIIFLILGIICLFGTVLLAGVLF